MDTLNCDASSMDFYFFFDNLFLHSTWRYSFSLSLSVVVLLELWARRRGRTCPLLQWKHRWFNYYLVFVRFNIATGEVDHLVDYENLFVIVFKQYSVERLVIFRTVIYVKSFMDTYELIS